MSKPPMVGTVWVAVAKLYNENYELIGVCTDTPNAIANALRELPEAKHAQSILGLRPREYYHSRMNDWNKCPSGLIRK